MKLQKTALTLALAAALNTGTSQADIISFAFDGVTTRLDPAGLVFQNKSQPYYYDTTWGYGLRTQISGSLTYDTVTGAGSSIIDPIEAYKGGLVVFEDFDFQSIGGDLLLGNIYTNWGGSRIATQLVLDASGLFAEINTGLSVGDVINASSCTASGACATPASENALPGGKYPIGPVPIATSSLNTVGQTGTTTTLGQLSLGSDDGIGGSPMDNGPFLNFNDNFDFTSLTVTEITNVPIPAAVWLFGSGLLGLIGVARRRKQT